jgi:GTPase SAR1 family protein
MAHLTSFTVENFKRFEHFEMNNIGQFNLIVGDNNVGKTSVLEALLITKSAEEYDWRLGKVLREYRHFTQPQQKNISYFINQNKPDWGITSEIIFRCLPDYELKIIVNEDTQLSSITGFELLENKELARLNAPAVDKSDWRRPDKEKSTKSMPYIPFMNTYNHDLTTTYQTRIQGRSTLRKQLTEDMREIIPLLDTFDINTTYSDSPVIILFQNGIERSLPLAAFGDGAVKLFRILTEIVVHSGNRLMIDEIDAGVHIGRFKDFWRTILKASITHNVQLFATTHNWECLQVFKKVLEEPEMVQYQEKARCFTLIESKVTQRVEAVCSTFAEFENAIETKTEIRGGAVAR